MGIVTCDVFLENHENRSEEEKILKEYHFSGQILQATSYCISTIDDSEALVELESQYDIINKLASYDFDTPHTEFQIEKATIR